MIEVRQAVPMDAVRFGRSVRALRLRRGWRQADVARAARVSRASVWRIERGRAARVSLAVLERVGASLGAKVVVRLDWQGYELDRLLDADHAALVESVVVRLHEDGWACQTEVTFSQFGERGSIDVLAWHEGARMLLVVEAKTLIPDVSTMLATLDRKVRLAPDIARDRGWPARSVSRVLVVTDRSTARRHVARLRSTFDTAFPERTVDVRRWLRQPDRRISGLWFLRAARPTSGITRVRSKRSAQTSSGPSQRRATG